MGFSLFYLKGVVPRVLIILGIYVAITPFVLLLLRVGICFVIPITCLPEQMYGRSG